MLRNAIERKKEFVVLYARANGKAYGIKLSYEQLELLERIGGRVHVTNTEGANLYIKDGKLVYLKTLLFGHIGKIVFKNGDKLDFRPENVEPKQFDLAEYLNELEG